MLFTIQPDRTPRRRSAGSEPRGLDPRRTPAPPARPKLAAVCAALLLSQIGLGAQHRGGQRGAVFVTGAIAAPQRPEAAAAGRGDEDDMPPRMPTNENVDRFLRRAQEFVDRGDWESATRILQRVVEGRVLEYGGGEEDADGAGTSNEGTPGEPEAGAEDPAAADARFAVYSPDGRLYLPVRDLCHRLLATMPAAAVAEYRSRYGLEAEAAARDATGDPAALEAVFDRYYATLAAGRALRDAADLRLDRGSVRAALHDYETLVEWPEAFLRDAGVDLVWLRVRLAICHDLLGDRAAAARSLDRLAEASPDASVRIEGRGVGVAGLPARILAADDRAAAGARRQDTTYPDAAAPEAPPTSFGRASKMIPLWEHRFADPVPYRPIRGAADRRIRVFRSSDAGFAPVPPMTRYRPGGLPVAIPGARVAFLDHNRLGIHDLVSGLALKRSAGTLQQPALRQGMPRTRIPAYDHATMRPVFHRGRVHVVQFPERIGDGMSALTDNLLVTLDGDTMEPVWSSSDLGAFSGATILSAPAAAGESLYLPVLGGPTVALWIVTAATGEVREKIPLHAGGTPLVRPVMMPPVVDEISGTVLLVTNAGAAAAVDLGTGSLSWIRRYERNHPFRDERPIRQVPPSTRRHPFGYGLLEAIEPPGFSPTDPIVSDGLLVFAPVDGAVVLALDVVSGEPEWMLPKDGIDHLIGFDDATSLVYARAREGLMGIGLRSGRREWLVELPLSASWDGRGTVVPGEGVLLPSEGDLFFVAVEAGRPPARSDVQRLQLGAFGYGTDGLAGPANVVVRGPWILLLHEGGVEVHTSRNALLELASASEPADAARYLALAGDLLPAIDALLLALSDVPEGRDRAGLERDLIALGREMATAMATNGARDEALALLDRCRAALTVPRLQARWRLARIDVFSSLGDLASVASEQDALERETPLRGPTDNDIPAADDGGKDE